MQFANVLFTILGLGIALGGCASVSQQSPIRMTIEELGAEGLTRNDGTLQFRSAISITGISQPISAGGIISVPGRNSPELLSTPLTSGCSRIVETVFESDADATTVRELGGALDGMRTALIKQAATAVVRKLHETLKARVSQVAAPAKPADDEQVRRILAALGKDTLPGEAEMATDLNAAIQEEQSAKAAVVTSQSKISSLSDKRNLIITRWSTDDRQSSGLTLGSFFGTSKSKAEERSGFLVMAGLRTAALELGADAVVGIKRTQRLDTVGPLSIFPDSFITHFTLGAKHHYFVEDRDLSKAVQASLKLSAAELTQIFGGQATEFLKAQSLAAEYLLATSVAASSRGALSSPSRKIYPFRLNATFTSARSADAERVRGTDIR